jgi:aldehyde dehydrogenase (NAD+)
MLHAGVPTAPFGGVGESGTGYYHGKHGFDAFTHTRTIVSPPGFLAKLLNFMQPPYDVKNIGKVRIANKLGFKRGETMEDQKIGQKRFASIATLLKLSAVVGVLAVVDRSTGENLGLSKLVLSIFKSAKARIGRS